MNCIDAEPFLDQFAKDSGGPGIPEEAGLRQHLASCLSCRNTLQMRQEWDRQLSFAIKDVAPPEGMANRLVALLQDAASVENGPVGSTRLAQNLGIRVWMLVSACLVVVTSLWFSITAIEFGRLSPSNIAILWEQNPEAIAVESTLPKRLPHGWSSLKNISGHEWQQIALLNPHLVLSVKPFEIRDRQREPEEGWLFVIPRSRWNSVPPSTASQSRVQYSSNRVWIDWSEGELVYVLALAGSPQSLERLQQQLDGGNAVF